MQITIFRDTWVHCRSWLTLFGEEPLVFVHFSGFEDAGRLSHQLFFPESEKQLFLCRGALKNDQIRRRSFTSYKKHFKRSWGQRSVPVGSIHAGSCLIPFLACLPVPDKSETMTRERPLTLWLELPLVVSPENSNRLTENRQDSQ